MAYKQFALDESTPVTIYKRRNSRNLRLSVASNGDIRVSIPLWAPYRTGLEFARARRAWIADQRQPQALLSDGQAVGKAHRLQLVADPAKTKLSSRIKGGAIVISYPSVLSASDLAVQDMARTAAIRALRKQAEQLLPQRLATLAQQHNFAYKSVSIKQLKGRWGSCDQQHNIVLNLYLMQLPWELIDYVLMHELNHTRILKHGPEFWGSLTDVLPDTKALRARMRDYYPVLAGRMVVA